MLIHATVVVAKSLCILTINALNSVLCDCLWPWTILQFDYDG